MSKPSAWRNRIVGHGEEAPDQLLANPLNWRVHPAFQQKALQDVLEKVGLVQSVVVNKRTGHLVDGHLRAQLAMRNGDNKLPVVYVDLSEDDERLVLATMDPLSAMAGTDKDKLSALLDDLRNDGVDTLLDQIKNQYKIPEVDSTEDVPPRINEAGELCEQWGTVKGQLWLLGKHRLFCADSTNADEIKPFKNPASLLVTSPPYWTKQEYDNKPLISGVREFMQRTAKAWAPNVRRRIVIDTGYTNEKSLDEKGRAGVRVMLDWEWTRAWRKVGWELRNRRIWVKGGGLLHMNPRSDLVDESCEMLLTFFRPGKNEGGQERTNEPWVQSGYWADIPGVGRNIIGDQHPCPYPVELVSRFIKLYSKIGDVVIDPFVGAGTTIIACENLQRLCHAVELSPAYCAVTLQRWLDTTGEKPKRA